MLLRWIHVDFSMINWLYCDNVMRWDSGFCGLIYGCVVSDFYEFWNEFGEIEVMLGWSWVGFVLILLDILSVFESVSIGCGIGYFVMWVWNKWFLGLKNVLCNFTKRVWWGCCDDVSSGFKFL